MTSAPITYGSVCSGIEAPGSAWHPLGWKPLWFSEIEPFPKAVLKHHYPTVPDLGDMTTLPARILAGEVPAPDVFVGGTPCQSFSVAGLRKGLADPRGQLTRTFVEIIDALDTVRLAAGKPPVLALWENVPGVLSDKDNAFGNFLGALAGEDDALQPPGGRWSNCGCVLGPQRTVAWRVLDAQYFGVAQRRRRVFAVISARSSAVDPVEVLLVEQGMRRDTPPSREAWQGTPASAARSADAGGEGRGAVTGSDGGRGGGVDAVAFTTRGRDDGLSVESQEELAYALKNPGSGGRSNDRMIAHVVALPLTATNDPSRSPQSAEVTAQVHAVLRAQNWDGQDTAPTLTGRLYGGLGAQTMPDKGNMGAVLQPVVMAHGQANAEVRTDGATPTLVCVHEAPIVALPPVVPYDLFQITAPINRQSRDERSPCHTLAKDNEAHAAVVMAAVAFHPTQDPISSTDGSTHAMGCGSSGGYATVAVAQPMAFNAYQRTEADVTWPLMAGDAKKVEVGVRTGMAVRRLTPEECERLQGFPDNHTRIPWKGKPASDCPDGPRYRALGNSMAVPVIAWIGRKIEERIAAAVATR